MQGKVTLEDHFAIEATLGDSQPFGPHVWPELRHRLLDFHDQRLRLMDAAGVEIMVASLNAPAIQGIADSKQAAEVARRANDILAAEIAKRPDRFAGVAALPMQDPETATQELERCIKDLGFKGALVNDYSQTSEASRMLHYDLLQYRPFWRAVESLEIDPVVHDVDLRLVDAFVVDQHLPDGERVGVDRVGRAAEHRLDDGRPCLLVVASGAPPDRRAALRSSALDALP